MEKIKEILKNLFTKSNLITGMIGFGFGMLVHVSTKLLSNYTFGDIAIFIGTGISFLIILFVLGYLMNNTLFKD